MMRRLTVTIFVTILFLASVVYVAFRNSDDFITNEYNHHDVYEKDFTNLNASERMKSFLKEVDYVAIVYPETMRIYPNSWFHRVVLGNPVESTTYTIKAKVEYTILGDIYNSIEYASAGVGLSGHSWIVGLCKSENNSFYAPDNGHEIPATEEAIKYSMSLTNYDQYNNNSSVCKK